MVYTLPSLSYSHSLFKPLPVGFCSGNFSCQGHHSIWTLSRIFSSSLLAASYFQLSSRQNPPLIHSFPQPISPPSLSWTFFPHKCHTLEILCQALPPSQAILSIFINSFICWITIYLLLSFRFSSLVLLSLLSCRPLCAKTYWTPLVGFTLQTYGAPTWLLFLPLQTYSNRAVKTSSTSWTKGILNLFSPHQHSRSFIMSCCL